MYFSSTIKVVAHVHLLLSLPPPAQEGGALVDLALVLGTLLQRQRVILASLTPLAATIPSEAMIRLRRQPASFEELRLLESVLRADVCLRLPNQEAVELACGRGGGEV